MEQKSNNSGGRDTIQIKARHKSPNHIDNSSHSNKPAGMMRTRDCSEIETVSRASEGPDGEYNPLSTRRNSLFGDESILESEPPQNYEMGLNQSQGLKTAKQLRTGIAADQYPDSLYLIQPDGVVKARIEKFDPKLKGIHQFYEEAIYVLDSQHIFFYFKTHLEEMMKTANYLRLGLKYQHLNIKPDNIIIVKQKELWPLLIAIDNPKTATEKISAVRNEKDITIEFASYDICQRLADLEDIDEAKPNEDLVQIAYTFLYLISDQDLFWKWMSPREARIDAMGSSHGIQDVADIKLSIEAEPNERKLKSRLRTMFGIAPVFEICLDLLTQFILRISLPLDGAHLDDLFTDRNTIFAN